jgi:serine/threonine-protein kinase
MILTPSGVVKLMDFGIARMVADRKLTQTGGTVGSIYYMSPEQIKGGVAVDARSDLYSLGISLYEMATGARPFKGDSEYSIMAAHLETTPPPPIEVDPNLPPALSEVILMSLEKDPAQRFQTADAFRAALLSVRGSVQPAATPAAAPVVVAPPPPPPPPARSHRGLYIALGSLATIAVIIAAATQIPKFRHTAAESAPAAAVSAPAQQAPPEAPPAAIPAAVPAPVETPSASQPPVTSAPAVKAAAQPVRRAPAAAASVQAPAPGQQQPVAQPVSPPPEAPPPQTSAASAAAAAAADAKAEQLEKLREEGSLLSIRVGTVKSSLDGLQKAQARTGLGLRADMAASAQRMDYLMNEADAALQRGDAAATQRNLDLAEKEVSKLEKFLGH